ncbi:MAG: PQQ-binding-like beta-propeller repeat protein, partial [Planctomycetota bacterium]
QSTSLHPLVSYDLNGNEQWRRVLSNQLYRSNFSHRRPDWPVIEDLNGDGNDELIVSLDSVRFGQQDGISVLRADVGTTLWKEPRKLVGTTGEQFQRVTTTLDLNNDGWREIAIASIAGPPASQASESLFRHVSGKPSARAGELFVYLDWISGRDGARLAWARHPIPWFSNQMRVCELDAIRALDLLSPGEVEVEVVSGDTDKDVELHAMTLRFRPDQPQASAVANGLSVCDPDPQRVGLGETRVYLHRPGPYRDSPEKLVMLSEKRKTKLRLGVSAPWVQWKSNGTRFLALRDLTDEGVQVIDAETDQTVWSIENVTRIRPLRRKEGRHDFLVQRGLTDPPKMIDGESGKVLWTVGGGRCGPLVHLQSIADPSGERILLMYLAGESPLPPPQPQTLVARYLDASTGQMVWSKKVGRISAFHGRSRGFTNFDTADLDGDNVVDLIGFRWAAEQQGQLFVINGANGKDLWQLPLNLWTQGSELRPPPIKVINTKAGRRLFVVRRTANRVSEIEAVLCNAATGEIESNVLVPGLSRWSWRDGYGWPEPTIGVVRGDDADVHQIGFVAFFTDRRSTFCRIRLSDDCLSEPTCFDPEALEGHHYAGWIMDVCGDETPERIAYDHYNQRLHCFDWSGEMERWSLEIPPDAKTRELRFDAELRRLITKDLTDDSTYSVIDTEKGIVLSTIEQSDERVRDAWPLILPASRQSPERLAIATDNGLKTQLLGDSLGRLRSFETHSRPDPRLVRKYPVGLLHSRQTLLQMFVYRFTQFILCILMVLLPGWYIMQSIRNPQWSLRWLMMGPLVAMVAMTLWYSRWSTDQPLIELVLVGILTMLGLRGVWHGLRNPRGDGLAMLALCVISMILFFGLYSIEPLRPPGVRYELTARDALILLTLFIGTSGAILVTARKLVPGLWKENWVRLRGKVATR